MKKFLIILLPLFSLLISACGNYVEEKESMTVGIIGEAESSSEAEKKNLSNDIKWGDSFLCINVKSSLDVSNIKTSDANKVEWSNADKSAVLISDEKEPNISKVIYKSDSGEIKNIDIAVLEKNKPDVCFLEADIDNDGKNELAIFYVICTGTGATQEMIDIFEFDSNKKLDTFLLSGNIQFTDNQIIALSKIFEEWNKSGYMEKMGLTKQPGVESNIDMFIPKVVKHENEYMIQVEFRSAEMNSKQLTDTIKVLLKYNGNQLMVYKMCS